MPLPAFLGPAAIGAAAAVGAYALWTRRNRAYLSSESVASAYDAWTEDRLLETLWGEHVHLGHYGAPPRSKDFRRAKADFVHELVRWSGLDQFTSSNSIVATSARRTSCIFSLLIMTLRNSSSSRISPTTRTLRR